MKQSDYDLIQELISECEARLGLKRTAIDACKPRNSQGSIPVLSGNQPATMQDSITGALAATSSDQPETIHIMRQGSPICRSPELRGYPWEWPAGHTWVSVADAEVATCDACKEGHALTECDPTG